MAHADLFVSNGAQERRLRADRGVARRAPERAERPAFRRSVAIDACKGAAARESSRAMSLEHRHHARCACGSALTSSRAAPRPFTLAGTKRVYERPRPFTIQHIALDLALDVDGKGPERQRRARHRPASIPRPRRSPSTRSASTIEAVGAHAAGREERLAARARVRRRRRSRVTVPVGVTAAQIQVRYRAVPRAGIYFLAPDEHVPDRPRQVWTQCQDEDARHIFPCHDKPHVKLTTELARHACPPAGTSSRTASSLSDASDAGAFHWKMSEPHPSYLFTLVAGEFTRDRRREVDGDPAHVPRPEGARGGRQTHLRAHAGDDSPLRRAHRRAVPVEQVRAGRRERLHLRRDGEHHRDDDVRAHPARRARRDRRHVRRPHRPRARAPVVRRSRHLPRLVARLAQRGLRDVHGARRARAPPRPRRVRLRRQGRHATRTSARRTAATGAPIVCQDYDAPIDIFDRHLYEKGGLVLHMLRRELGDTLFWAGVKTYLTRHAQGRRRDARPHARPRGGERPQPRALLRAVGLPRRPPRARREDRARRRGAAPSR